MGGEGKRVVFLLLQVNIVEIGDDSVRLKRRVCVSCMVMSFGYQGIEQFEVFGEEDGKEEECEVVVFLFVRIV